MGADGDTALAGQLHGLVTDLLAWLDDYPDDQVDPDAVASFRQRTAVGEAEASVLTTVTGLLVNLVWWRSTSCGSSRPRWA